MSRRNHHPAPNERFAWAVLGLADPATAERVDATRAREHARALADRGWGTRSIAKRAGVGRRAVQSLLNGRTAKEPPSHRVLETTEALILAIDLEEAPPWQQNTS
ncbi:hypothetical protein [Nocardiopsis sp. FR26]|uniref:hypothetical protein n=1 Tax=Nocardiopsis sp. FR26 TaxID=2605987 RepID=UPI001357494B|nr:hypothetical protein [Nocardiopsis sp. FR26]